MSGMRMIGRLAATLILIGVIAAGSVALFTDAEARGPCRCPQVYAPVECDNGKTYPNQCVADCKRARNCVPVGLP